MPRYCCHVAGCFCMFFYFTFRCPTRRKSRRHLQLLVASWVCFVAGGDLGTLALAAPNSILRNDPFVPRRLHVVLRSWSSQCYVCAHVNAHRQCACWPPEPPSMNCYTDYHPNVPCCRCILLSILVWDAVGKAIGNRLAPPSPMSVVDEDQTPLLGHAHQQPQPVLR
jgi:hypothetical protein